MKVSHQLSLCFVALFLLTSFCVMGHNLAQAEEKHVAERLVSINLEDQDFTQAMAAIADQAGITIKLHGQTPAGKRDISVTIMPLNEAMAQILRLYGVRNHAAAYNPEKKTVMLAILETSTHVAALSPQTEPKIDILKSQLLTDAQLALLQEHSEIIVAEMEESALPLVPFQIEQLREQSSAMETEMEDNQPLTPEQLERLREQSRNIQEEEESSSQPLTEEQLQRLSQQSRIIEEEEERASQPLSEEQLQRLQKQNQDE
jgi:hypothetical protein